MDGDDDGGWLGQTLDELDHLLRRERVRPPRGHEDHVDLADRREFLRFQGGPHPSEVGEADSIDGEDEDRIHALRLAAVGAVVGGDLPDRDPLDELFARGNAAVRLETPHDRRIPGDSVDRVVVEVLLVGHEDDVRLRWKPGEGDRGGIRVDEHDRSVGRGDGDAGVTEERHLRPERRGTDGEDAHEEQNGLSHLDLLARERTSVPRGR